MSEARLSACMLFSHEGHNNTIQVYSVTVMTHVIGFQAGQSSQGTFEPVTPVIFERPLKQLPPVLELASSRFIKPIHI